MLCNTSYICSTVSNADNILVSYENPSVHLLINEDSVSMEGMYYFETFLKHSKHTELEEDHLILVR